MKPSSALTLAWILLSAACTTSTSSDPGQPAPTSDPAPDPSGSSASSDTPPPADNGPKKYGTLTDHGDRRVDVTNLTNPPACDDVCKTVQGTCNTAYAGDDDYRADHATDGQYTSFGGRFYDCSYPEQATLVQGNQTFRLDSLSCMCGGAKLDKPYVDVVTAKDGAHACSEVCTSWSLGCGEGYVYATKDGAESKITCDAVPPASSDHYQCFCKSP